MCSETCVIAARLRLISEDPFSDIELEAVVPLLVPLILRRRDLLKRYHETKVAGVSTGFGHVRN